jgi:hypothetical protein
VFNGGTDDDGEGDYGIGAGLARYGWLHVVESLAERDITKFKAVLDSPAAEVFTHLTYMADYTALQKQIIRQANNG